MTLPKQSFHVGYQVHCSTPWSTPQHKRYSFIHTHPLFLQTESISWNLWANKQRNSGISLYAWNFSHRKNVLLTNLWHRMTSATRALKMCARLRAGPCACVCIFVLCSANLSLPRQMFMMTTDVVVPVVAQKKRREIGKLWHFHRSWICLASNHGQRTAWLSVRLENIPAVLNFSETNFLVFTQRTWMIISAHIWLKRPGFNIHSNQLLILQISTGCDKQTCVLLSGEASREIMYNYVRLTSCCLEDISTRLMQVFFWHCVATF